MKRFTLVLLAFLSCCCTSASARVFNSPGSMNPGEYKYVENPDKTFTEYYQDPTGGLVKGSTYSNSGMAEADRMIRELQTDAGTTGQNAAAVGGSDGTNEYAANKALEAIRTGELYKNPFEEEVGAELADGAVAEGLLPGLASIAGATSGAIITGGGAIAMGVALGNSVDALLGYPHFGEKTGASAGAEEERRFSFLWGDEILLGKVRTCKEVSEISSTMADVKVILTKEEFEHELCFNAEMPVTDYRENLVEGHWTAPFITEEITLSGKEEPGGSQTFPGVSLADCPKVWLLCSRTGGGVGLFSTLFKQADVHELAFPDAGLKSLEHGVGRVAPGHLNPLSPVKTPISVPEPAEVPAPARHFVIEHAKEEAGKPVVTPIEEPGPEEKTIPSPLDPEVPTPKPLELGTDYKTEVETAGFTDVEVKEVAESATDFSVGPSEVVGVDPAPGTRAAPSTKVDISINPADAPPPTPAPSIPGVTSPGLKMPDFGVLCTNFPFGVPCWLVEEFSRWSTTSVVPKWTIPLEVPFLGWKTELKLDLSFLEPAMEIIRPLLALMATIGLVVMFFHFALGGTGAPPGGDADE